jgi:hypothetical protein
MRSMAAGWLRARIFFSARSAPELKRARLIQATGRAADPVWLPIV